MEFDNVKTWLLTGISPDVERQVRANLKTTQREPILSRQALGAVLTQFTMTQPYKNVNGQIKSTQNRGTFSPDTGNIYKQTKATGKDAKF